MFCSNGTPWPTAVKKERGSAVLRFFLLVHKLIHHRSPRRIAHSYRTDHDCLSTTQIIIWLCDEYKNKLWQAFLLRGCLFYEMMQIMVVSPSEHGEMRFFMIVKSLENPSKSIKYYHAFYHEIPWMPMYIHGLSLPRTGHGIGGYLPIGKTATTNQNSPCKSNLHTQSSKDMSQYLRKSAHPDGQIPWDSMTHTWTGPTIFWRKSPIALRHLFCGVFAVVLLQIFFLAISRKLQKTKQPTHKQKIYSMMHFLNM